MVHDRVRLPVRRTSRNSPFRDWDGGARRISGRASWILAAAIIVGAAVGASWWALDGFGREDGLATPATGAPGAGPARPSISVPREISPSVPGFVSTLRGLVEGAATLTVNGEPVALEPGGAFTVHIAQGETHLQLVATGADGTVTDASVGVTTAPAPAAYPATAAVHVRAADWADPVVRQQVIGLIEAGRIGAVELDIKDEAGEVGYLSRVPLASTVGATRAHYDPAEAVAELHARGVRVIGRIVCFLDPVTAGWAWSNARLDMIVLDHTGAAPLTNDYGTAAFTNLANAEIRQYQIDLATEAAALGFDEILYDYVRRPEGPLEAMQFPGLDVAPAVAVARFVADTDRALAASGAHLGISVFGIAATRPEAIGQDISLLAPHVDYVAPMVYPSHWGPGEYGVDDPLRQPADIVGASVADFHRLVAGSGAAVVPWLQDFDAGDVAYGTTEVAAQIHAAAASGASGYLLWNATSRYHTDALPPLPPAG